MKVLIATEDLTDRLLLQLMLRRLGHEPSTVSDGAELLGQIQSEKPEAVLLDLQSPVHGGSEAVHSVIDGEAGIFRPVFIGLTSTVRPNDRQSQLERMMDDFLQKPLAEMALRDLLERAVSRRRGHSMDAESHADPTAVWVSSVSRRLESLGLFDDPREAAKLIADFLFAADHQVVLLSDPMIGYDKTALTNVAHDLAVLNSVMGLEDLSARCKELEVTAVAGEGPLSSDLRLSVTEAYRRLRPQLLRFRTTLLSAIGRRTDREFDPAMRKGNA